jgi:hypothetical protein
LVLFAVVIFGKFSIDDCIRIRPPTHSQMIFCF